MYNYILSIFSKKHPSLNNSSLNHPSPFNKEFRKGYKNAWIDNIKDYTP